MSRFVEGADRAQASFLPACLEDFVDEDNPARAIDAFVSALDLDALGFRSQPAATGRPGYHPATLLCLYIYGYLNRIQSSRRLERECHRNVELMWLTGRLAPDFKPSPISAAIMAPQSARLVRSSLSSVGRSVYFSARWRWWMAANSKA